jgi:hypothetical protein
VAEPSIVLIVLPSAARHVLKTLIEPSARWAYSAVELAHPA